jgi:hypothetical protein
MFRKLLSILRTFFIVTLVLNRNNVEILVAICGSFVNKSVSQNFSLCLVRQAAKKGGNHAG